MCSTRGVLYRVVCLEQVGRVGQAGEHVFAGEGGVLGEDVVDAVAGGEEAQHRACGDAGALDGGLAAADVGIDDDALHD